MKLPNFDEFEPLIAIRKKMDAKSDTPLSLVKIDRLNALDVDTSPLDWSTPAAQKKEAATPIVSTPPAAMPEEIMVEKMAPMTPAPIKDAPTIAPAKPSEKSAARPTSKAPAPPTKLAVIFSRVLAVIAFTSVCVALLLALMTYKKKDYVPAAKTTPPLQMQPQKTAPPLEKKVETPAAAAPITPPTRSAPTSATASPATSAEPAPSTAAEHENNGSDTPTTQPVILTPEPTQEVMAPDAIDNTSPTDDNAKPPITDGPTPEEQEEMLGIRIGETRPDTPPPVKKRPKNPSELDYIEGPFSDALRNAGKSWYTTIERQKKPPAEEP